jgi:diguanylate cyclase (GGDEF)-like protein
MIARLNLPYSLGIQRVIIGLIALGVAAVDFFTGSEIRIYPFYFLPIALAAINLGRRDAMLNAAACAGLWAFSNYHAGLRYSADWILGWNVVVQGTAFAFVAWLISNLKESHTRESEQARVDRLTGLLNGRAFHEQAPHLLALCKRESTPVVMAYIDLDNFKLVNDTHGHQRGDDVLRIAAQVMKATLRTSDILVRLGGDEFAVLLPNTTAEEAYETLERLRESISSGMTAAGREVTASIGAAAYPNAPSSLDDLIGAADSAMYVVKTSGKNRVHISSVDSNREFASDGMAQKRR